MKKLDLALQRAEMKIIKSCQTDVGAAFKRFMISSDAPKFVDMENEAYLRIITAVSFNIRETFYGANKLIPELVPF